MVADGLDGVARIVDLRVVDLDDDVVDLEVGFRGGGVLDDLGDQGAVLGLEVVGLIVAQVGQLDAQVCAAFTDTRQVVATGHEVEVLVAVTVEHHLAVADLGGPLAFVIAADHDHVFAVQFQDALVVRVGVELLDQDFLAVLHMPDLHVGLAVFFGDFDLHLFFVAGRCAHHLDRLLAFFGQGRAGDQQRQAYHEQGDRFPWSHFETPRQGLRPGRSQSAGRPEGVDGTSTGYTMIRRRFPGGLLNFVNQS